MTETPSQRGLGDLALVRRALARDPEAIREFSMRVACCAPHVRRTAGRHGFHLADSAVDDIAQEAYLALWRKLADYDGLTRLESWACGFASVEFLRWRTRQMRGREQQEEDLESIAPTTDPFLVDDTGRIVDRALEQVGPPTSTIIRMKCFEDLTFEAIAARLRLSANTVKSSYYRGLVRLRASMGLQEEDVRG